MDDFESAVSFRNLAAREGLVIEGFRHPEGSFYYDLNQGGFSSLADAAKVVQIVTLARQEAGHEDHGEHVAMLNLVAKRSELSDKKEVQRGVYWHRPYHVSATPDLWISLEDWLKEQGHPYVPAP